MTTTTTDCRATAAPHAAKTEQTFLRSVSTA